MVPRHGPMDRSEVPGLLQRKPSFNLPEAVSKLIVERGASPQGAQVCLGPRGHSPERRFCEVVFGSRQRKLGSMQGGKRLACPLCGMAEGLRSAAPGEILPKVQPRVEV